MPIPTPEAGETQDDFHGRCMAAISGEYPEDQANAICYSQWEQRAMPGRTLRMVLRSELSTEDSPDSRVVTVRCSTEGIGRDKLVLVSRGIQLDNYRNNPVWLWQHNPDWPIARSNDISIVGSDLVARVAFPDAGVSPRADEIYGLIRAGVINAASTGFDPISTEPFEIGDVRGVKITASELQEMSFVSIPAVPDALVTERALAAARHRAQGIAMREDVKSRLITRDLYDVAQLAYLLDELGYAHNSAQWESDYEQDASKVPAMLADALRALADAFLAMSAEEVGEMLSNVEPPVPDEAVPAEVEIVAQSATPAIARFRIGLARAARAAAIMRDAAPRIVRRDKGLAKHRAMGSVFARERLLSG